VDVTRTSSELPLVVTGERALEALALWRLGPLPRLRVWLEDGAAWVEPAEDGGYLLCSLELVDGNEPRVRLNLVRDRSSRPSWPGSAWSPASSTSAVRS
jgi:hypothetical protein